MTLTDIQSLTTALVRDDAGNIATADRDSAIALAVSRYSKDRPRVLVEDLTSAGGQLLDLPAGWEAGFSAIQSLEYPIGNAPPTLLALGTYELYQGPADTQILLVDGLAAGAQVRARYTVQHVATLATYTPPGIDAEPLASYAAAILCDQLASLYSNDTDSSIQADAVDHTSKAREFALRAKTLRKRYYDELGIEPKRNVAAGVVVDMDLNDSRGRDRLTHPGRYR